ncbi:fimbrial protein [Dryocola clanedunensis]|uniref:fimbrial protein n=1 Tax=Cedecea sulfonylureivorans TaxID=3051154 RepID=UPI0019291FAF|nr:fimbrial protein [Cedecea sulfonylureivorans]
MQKNVQSCLLILATLLVGYSGNVLAAAVTMNFTGRVLATSCTLASTTPINVQLGSRKAHTDFFGVGTASPWIAFAINLDCPAGLIVKSQIDATADASGTPGVMRLDSGTGVATGVGVQLFLDTQDTAVVFGQPKEYTTTTVEGPLAVRYKARYYQTSSTITTGLANATAQFTLTYQ